METSEGDEESEDDFALSGMLTTNKSIDVHANNTLSSVGKDFMIRADRVQYYDDQLKLNQKKERSANLMHLKRKNPKKLLDHHARAVLKDLQEKQKAHTMLKIEKIESKREFDRLAEEHTLINKQLYLQIAENNKIK